MKDDSIKLPPLFLPGAIGKYTKKEMQDYAREAIEDDRKRRGDPVAWMTEDGRVCSAETRNTAMPNVSRVLFNIPLYRSPQPADPIPPNSRELEQPTEPVKPHTQFDDPRAQKVYEIICGDNHPPEGEHWDGYVSRLIVDALFPVEPVKEPCATGICLAAQSDGVLCADDECDQGSGVRSAAPARHPEVHDNNSVLVGFADDAQPAASVELPVTEQEEEAWQRMEASRD